MVDTKNKHHSQLIRLCSHKMLIGRTLPPSNVFKTLKQQPSQTKSASITRCNPAFLEEATQIVSQFFTIKMRRKLHLDQMPIGHTKPLTSNRITERILSLKDLWISSNSNSLNRETSHLNFLPQANTSQSSVTRRSQRRSPTHQLQNHAR